MVAWFAGFMSHIHNQHFVTSSPMNVVNMNLHVSIYAGKRLELPEKCLDGCKEKWTRFRPLLVGVGEYDS